MASAQTDPETVSSRLLFDAFQDTYHPAIYTCIVYKYHMMQSQFRKSMVYSNVHESDTCTVVLMISILEHIIQLIVTINTSIIINEQFIVHNINTR